MPFFIIASNFLKKGNRRMHTVVILSDRLKQDDQVVQNIKKLFPECKVQIISKTSEKSKNSQIHANAKGSRHPE